MLTNILGIGSPAHYWQEIIQPNRINFLKTPTAREAYNYCSSLWHVIDWLKEDLKYNPNNLAMENFRSTFLNQCPSLGVMHDIVTLAKHQKMSRSKGGLKSCTPNYEEAIFYAKTKTPVPKGMPPNLPQLILSGEIEELVSEHPSSYTIILENGVETTLHEQANISYEFWAKYFKNND